MISYVWLLLWAAYSGCASGPADHVVYLPDWATCQAVERTMAGEWDGRKNIVTECRSLEWATTVTEVPCDLGH